MRATEKEKKRRRKVAHDLAVAAQHLRIYHHNGLAIQVDEIADGIYTGHIIDRPVQ